MIMRGEIMIFELRILPLYFAVLFGPWIFLANVDSDTFIIHRAPKHLPITSEEVLLPVPIELPPYVQPVYFEVPEKYRTLFAYCCMKYELDPNIMYNLINMESHWNQYRVSPENYDDSKDYGLMQLNSTYFEYFQEVYHDGKPFDWRNVRDNMEIGFAHFKTLVDSWNGDYELALLSYNWGIGNVTHMLTYNTRTPPESTQYYINYILEREHGVTN
jgi:soluble lytic murein transglycosylase-like protein